MWRKKDKCNDCVISRIKAKLIWVRELALQGPERLGNSEVFTIRIVS